MIVTAAADSPMSRPTASTGAQSPHPKDTKAKRKRKGTILELNEAPEEGADAASLQQSPTILTKEYRPVCHNPFFRFQSRFPVELWQDGAAFFEKE